ncbi:hypothetical protein ACJMK2_004277 [Sinanodonta woodiana]|uniref:Major facilitator superfamily (MFS) profile domain-containing protein n=1 Tax=Sinanodonta woodiana TaxID=1069815 RepID=A0ABD3Y0N7_SINWO
MAHHRWIVIISTYIVETISVGLCSAFPVLFSTLLETFGESRARTATTPSIIFGVTGCSGIINGLLVQRIGPCKSGFIAGMLMGIGWMVCFFSTSILFLDFLLAVPMGIGTSVILLSANRILSHHFTGNAGIIALSVQTTASGVGRILFTYILTACSETFHLQWSLLLMGAMLLNCSILPFLWQTEQSSNRQKATQSIDKTCEKQYFCFQCVPVLMNKIFIIFCLIAAFSLVPHGGFLIVFTDVLRNQGLSEESITTVYLIHSISSLVGRISFVLLKQVPRIDIFFIALLLACMSIISFSTIHLAEDFKTAAIAWFFLGFEGGAMVSAIPVGTLIILGPKQMPSGMGFIFTVTGVGSVVVGPIIGLIRDRTGSYSMSLWTSTTSAGTAAVLCIAAIIIKHRAQRKKVKPDIVENGFSITKL